MPLKVLIVPDKFKGTLSAAAAAQAIAAGWRLARPLDVLELLPMSDGGDGFGETLGAVLEAKVEAVATVDAAHRPCVAAWWWVPKSRMAIIESARVIGLTKLPPGKFHPFALDTFGLGAVIRAAAAKGAKHCLMGIGGSATNDGGFGLARSLGWEFLDADGSVIEDWTRLCSLVRIIVPKRTIWFEELVVAVDVQNPLLGARGCTRVFGPQKGLAKKDFPLAECCLRRMAEVVQQYIRSSRREEALTIPSGMSEEVRASSRRLPQGDGAAGGLGFGLREFFGARLESGFDLFARCAGLERRLATADVVITGEGAIDRSTFMGKGVGEIAKWCQGNQKPCLGVAGEISDSVRNHFTDVQALTETTTVAEAKKRPGHWLRRLTAETARQFRRKL